MRDIDESGTISLEEYIAIIELFQYDLTDITERYTVDNGAGFVSQMV